MDRKRLGLGLSLAVALLVAAGWGAWAYSRSLHRFAAVVPGKVYRSAWPSPSALAGAIEEHGLRGILTLTAINKHDPKWVAQSGALEGTGINWHEIPMRGSTATLEQMAEGADWIADPGHQPALLHCVGGHHRSSLIHAAYRIRYEGWDAERAWEEVSRLPWARPSQDSDQRDHARIVEFASWNRRQPPPNAVPAAGRVASSSW